MIADDEDSQIEQVIITEEPVDPALVRRIIVPQIYQPDDNTPSSKKLNADLALDLIEQIKRADKFDTEHDPEDQFTQVNTENSSLLLALNNAITNLQATKYNTSSLIALNVKCVSLDNVTPISVLYTQPRYEYQQLKAKTLKKLAANAATLKSLSKHKHDCLATYEHQLKKFSILLKNTGIKPPSAKLAADELFENIAVACQKINIDKLTDSIEIRRCNIAIKQAADCATSRQLMHERAKAAVLRKMSYAATVAWAMQFKTFCTANLNHAQALALEKEIKALVNSEIEKTLELLNDKAKQIKDLDTDLPKFVNKLALLLEKKTKVAAGKIGKEIIALEQYYVAELNSNRCLVTKKTAKRNQENYEVEIPLNAALTDAQKTEFLQVHDYIVPEPPSKFEKILIAVKMREQGSWLDGMSATAREWLKTIVPKNINDDWSTFEAQRFVSNTQDLGILKNARQNHYITEDQDNNLFVKSSSTKIATTVPINLKGETKRRLVRQVVAQLFTFLTADKGAHFREHWGLGPDGLHYQLPNEATKIIKPVIFMQSLLSKIPLLFGARKFLGIGLDNFNVKAQEDAINDEKKNFEAYYDIEFGNDPANGFRNWLTYEQKGWEHTERLIDKATDLLTALALPKIANSDDYAEVQRLVTLAKGAVNKINDRADTFKTALINKINESRPLLNAQKQVWRKYNVERIIACIRYLSVLCFAPDVSDRNKRIIKAAIQAMLVEAMGGEVSVNCKSGKDRTGEEKNARESISEFSDEIAAMKIAAMDEIAAMKIAPMEKAAKLRSVDDLQESTGKDALFAVVIEELAKISKISAEFPDYNDTGFKRLLYSRIYRDVFRQKLTQESAGLNAPGAFGIKDDFQSKHMIRSEAMAKGFKRATVITTSLAVATGIALTLLSVIGVIAIANPIGLGVLGSLGCLALISGASFYITSQIYKSTRPVIDVDIAKTMPAERHMGKEVSKGNKVSYKKYKEIDNTKHIELKTYQPAYLATDKLYQRAEKWRDSVPAHCVRDPRLQEQWAKLETFIATKNTSKEELKPILTTLKKELAAEYSYRNFIKRYLKPVANKVKTTDVTQYSSIYSQPRTKGSDDKNWLIKNREKYSHPSVQTHVHHHYYKAK